MFFGAYWSRQMTDAPTIEMAIGMKTSDLAMLSHRPARCESTAITRPSTVAPIVTVNIHQIVLENVPRITEKKANATTKKPAAIVPREVGEWSRPDVRLRVQLIE